MTILTRVSRLFKADIHGILENLEQPESILKQAVRDMQDAIDKATANINRLTKQQECLHQKQQTQTLHIDELQQQLRFCFAENNDALAKPVIRKKLHAELSLRELARQLKNTNEEITRKITETEERQEKLQSVRDKLALFTEQNELYETATATDPNTTITQDDVELALLTEKQRYAELSASTGEQP
jgi:phage shock protein A